MSDRPNILIVDDEPRVRELLTRHLESEGYSCADAEDGQAALDALEAESDSVDLVISDINMPRLDGMALLERIVAGEAEIPVVMITSMADIDTAVAALGKGAAEYLLKPFNLDAVTIAIERALERHRLVVENRSYQADLEAMVEKKTADLRDKNQRIELQAAKLRRALQELEQTSSATLRALVAAIETRDTETSQHNERVQEYSCLLGRHMGHKGNQLRDLSWGALLHDVGKIGVPDSILRKPGRLTVEEWAQMKRHPVIGYRILSSIPFLEGAAKIVLYHHERFDGMGYPYGKKGEEIPLHARIFSVVDAFDAITSARPYHIPRSFEVAMEEIGACAGAHFDPDVVEAFLALPLEELRKARRIHETSAQATRGMDQHAAEIQKAISEIRSGRGISP